MTTEEITDKAYAIMAWIKSNAKYVLLGIAALIVAYSVLNG